MMMHKIRRLPGFFVILVMLVGCKNGSSSTEPTSITLSPSQTAAPLQTPVQAAVQTPTSTPYQIITVSPTEAPIISPTLSWTKELVTSTSSPDANWIAELFLEVDQNGDEKAVSLVVTHTDGTRWIAEDNKIYGFDFDYAWPFHWSNIGQYLYFTHRGARSDGCFGFFDSNGSDLWQLDLMTGSVKKLVSKVGHWLALSPDETTLAYLSHWPRRIVLRDLATGEEEAADLKILHEYPNRIVYASHLVWSPNAQSLAFTLEIDTCGDSMTPPHSIIIINANTLEQRTIVNEDIRPFYTDAWKDDTTIVLKDYDGNMWELNILNGQIDP